MAGINKVFILGNLGFKPEVKTLNNGDAVVNFTVATSESWTDKQTGEKKEKTEWHSIVAYRRIAEIVGQYLDKGSKVHIEGKLETQKYTDKSGVEKYKTQIICNELQMLDSKGSNNSEPRQSKPVKQAEPIDQFDDDIPF